jgi:SAM-dependent methyltransferase
MSQVMQKKIWDHFQTRELNVFSGAHPRLTFLADQVPVGGRMLNVGVGDGFTESYALTRGVEVFSLDPSEAAIKRLATILGDERGARFKAGFVEEIPFPDNSFDVVIMSEVLEHLGDESLNKALLEVDRVLKQDGKFIGTVPADEDLVQNLIYCPCCEATFHRWGHQQSFSKERFSRVLEMQFREVRVQRAYFPNWEQLSWKGKVLAFAKLCFCKFGNGGAGENWYFVAKKKVGYKAYR